MLNFMIYSIIIVKQKDVSMIRILLLLALLAMPIFGSAQTTSKPKMISLLANQDKVNDTQFYFQDFIDERTTKDYIGQVQKGMMNVQSPLNFKRPINVEILSYLNHLMPQTNEKTPLVFVLHQLWVTEKTTFSSEKGMLDITIEIRSAGDGSSLGTFSHFIEKGGLDVTNGHEKRIRQGIVACLNKFFIAQKDPTILYHDKAQKIDLSKGIPGVLQKGFYINFANIEYNRPEENTSAQARIKTVNELVKRYIFTYAHTKKKRKEYAYYSGNNLLLNAYSIGLSAGYYLEPYTDGRYLLYVDKYPRPGAAVAFGALGAAASTKTRANILDLRTGIIREVDKDYMSELLKDHPTIGQSYLQSDQDIPAMIDHVQQLNEVLMATE